jgi:flagellar hook-associated protein 3 FlgL
MRVTPGILTARITANLQRALSGIARQQEQIDSGKRINRPSDDPGGTAQALTVRSRLAANAQFQRNVAEVRESLGSADSVLRGVVDAMQRAHELAVQGGNDSNSAPDRQALAGEINQLLESMVAYGNSRGQRDTMLFGGQETTTAPYTVTRDAQGRITAVTANPLGIDGPTAVEVMETLTVAPSVSGTTAFGAPTDPTSTFAVLISLRDALDANDGTAVRASLAGVDAALDRASMASVVVGTRLSWVGALDDRLKDESLVLSSSLSRVEDADIAGAVAQLTTLQTTYQAGLAASARTLQQSLLDFLR